jgi:hypothetical protein
MTLILDTQTSKRESFAINESQEKELTNKPINQGSKEI